MTLPPETWFNVLLHVLLTCQGPKETRHTALLHLCRSSRDACLLPSVDNVFLAILITVQIQKNVTDRLLAPLFTVVPTRPQINGFTLDHLGRRRKLLNEVLTVDSGVDWKVRLRFAFQPVYTGDFTVCFTCSSVEYRISREATQQEEGLALFESADTNRTLRDADLTGLTDEEILSRATEARLQDMASFHQDMLGSRRPKSAPTVNVHPDTASVERLVMRTLLNSFPDAQFKDGGSYGAVDCRDNLPTGGKALGGPLRQRVVP